MKIKKKRLGIAHFENLSQFNQNGNNKTACANAA